MRLAELGNRRVAVWGFGREGRAALGALRERLPAQRFTLFCRPAEVEAARAFDAALEVVDGGQAATRPAGRAISSNAPENPADETPPGTLMSSRPPTRKPV